MYDVFTGGGQLDPPPPLQISVVDGPIGVRIGKDIKKHLRSIAALFSTKKCIQYHIIIYA